MPTFNCLNLPVAPWKELQDPNYGKTLFLCPGAYDAVFLNTGLVSAPDAAFTGLKANFTDYVQTNSVNTYNLRASNDIIISNHLAIGTLEVPDQNYALSVNGKIRAKKLVVSQDWADYVFHKDYQLMSISQLEKFIHENGHLPEIPASTEIEKNGVDLGEIVKKQMAKIEELSLYIIEQNKRMDQLEALIKNQQK